MFFKLITLTALIVVAKAGVIGTPLASSYSYAAPLAYHAPAPLAYHAPAQLAYHAPAPLAYHAPAPLAYHTPAQLAYHAPAQIAKLAAPVALAKTVVQEEYDPNPQYSYAYDVQDAITGDNKQQQETRNGDVVQGSYSLVESDGTRRVVQYTADPINGFNAVVSKEPLAVKVAAAPLVAKTIAPFAYAAPVAKYAAPLAYSASY